MWRRLKEEYNTRRIRFCIVTYQKEKIVKLNKSGRIETLENKCFFCDKMGSTIAFVKLIFKKVFSRAGRKQLILHRLLLKIVDKLSHKNLPDYP